MLYGVETTVRKKKTRELLNVVTEIKHPWERVHLVPGRKANPWLALSEMLWMMAGRNDVKCLSRFNKRIEDFSDDGETFYGAYGYRIRDQIEPLIQRLRNDPFDRRAVLSIWRPEDLTAETRDAPCNDMVIFKLRPFPPPKLQLHMTVINRSNDLHWGLYAVNLYQFGFLQEYIAARLGIYIGTQTHISNSLHIYLEGPGAKITERMLQEKDKPLPELPRIPPMIGLGKSYNQFVEDCNWVLESLPYKGIQFLEFARDFLFLHCSRKGMTARDFERECRWGTHYVDWCLAAEEFSKP